MRTIRLAVLLCDEIDFTSVHINYGKIFQQYLTSSLKLITPDVKCVLDEYKVKEAMDFPPDDIHYEGMLVSGSRASVNDDTEWVKKLLTYIQRIATEKPATKLFGFCFGHQAIAKALGANVVTGDWEVSVTTIYLSNIGRAIFNTDRLKLQLSHHDRVLETPPGTYLLGVSEDVDNQGFVKFRGAAPSSAELEADPSKLTSIQVLTLQGHPEATELVLRKLIHEHAAALGEALVEDALARVGLPTDALDKAGAAIWGVLGVPSDLH